MKKYALLSALFLFPGPWTPGPALPAQKSSWWWPHREGGTHDTIVLAAVALVAGCSLFAPLALGSIRNTEQEDDRDVKVIQGEPH